MALFVRTYVMVPPKDLKKTTLKQGNPFRGDHVVIGVGLVRASLYKLPSHPDFMIYLLWDDPEYDPLDPEPSEEWLVGNVLQEVLREVERVQGDAQIRYKDHYLVGTELLHQLGILYQKCIQYRVHRPETIFHALLGATAIDLSALMSMVGEKGTLKPTFPLEFVKSHQIGELSRRDEIDAAFLAFRREKVRSMAENDLQTLLNTYHYLKQI